MDRITTHEVKDINTSPDGGDPGAFEALVSVFGNVDSYGDRMVKGAFTDTLENHGLPPIVWSHDWRTPPIGTSSKATEEDAGLVVAGSFLLDVPIAAHVYKAMKAKNGDGRSALRRWSFGYDTTKYSFEKSDDPNAWGGEVRNLEAVDLWECGPCLVGVNLTAETLALKGVPTPDSVREHRRASPDAGGAKAWTAQDRETYLTAVTGRR